MTGDDQNKRKIARHTKKLLIENLNLEEKTEMVPLELNSQIWQNFVQRKNWVLHEKLNLIYLRIRTSLSDALKQNHNKLQS